MFDEALVKMIAELGSTGLAAVLLFWALRYVIKSCNDRADADRELFSSQLENIRVSYDDRAKAEREAHEREIKEVCADFKLCVERMSSSTRELSDQVRSLRSASNAH